MIMGFATPTSALGPMPRALGVFLVVGLTLTSAVSVQDVSAVRQQPPQTTPPPSVERLGKDLFRIGKTRVNTATREVTVTGTVNPVTTLEFLANPPRGLKAYESALTL